MKIFFSINALCLFGLPIVKSGGIRPKTQRVRTAADFETTAASWKTIKQEQSGLLQELKQAEVDIAEEEESIAELMEALDVFEPMSMSPTLSPVHPSDSPSAVPTEGPTRSVMPSLSPTTSPTTSNMPSLSPTTSPTTSNMPSLSPSNGTDTEPIETLSPTTSVMPSTEPTFGPTESAAPSELPTLSDCGGRTPEERSLAIFALLDTVANSTYIRDLTTPQGKATEWIIGDDPRRLCPEDPKFIQRWALAVMYYSTGGDLWLQCFDGSLPLSEDCGLALPFINRDPFLSESSECEWAGISCDVDACVTEVEFEANNLVGTIPTEMGLLHDLVILGMEQGALQGTIPTEIGGLTNLIFLDLDFNLMTGTLPSELWQLTNLRTLDLDNNFFWGNIDGIGALTQLEFLQLHINFFVGTVPEDVGSFSNLSTFNLHENSFTGTMPDSVCALRIPGSGLLTSLIADCAENPETGDPPQIECETPACCTQCRV